MGQPLCADCYDYRGHVEFSWHAPALWHRFTIALRRQLVRRLRRPPLAGVDAGELVGLIVQAAANVRLRIETPAGTDVVRFGSQIEAQPVTSRVGGTDDRDGIAGRRVAGYLAKYVTKSVADFGLGTHRISPHAIATLPVCEHVRRILHTIAELAHRPGRATMLTWLHCLGFRGHITTKTRRYSITLQALRARRFRWQTMRNHLPADATNRLTSRPTTMNPSYGSFGAVGTPPPGRGCSYSPPPSALASAARPPAMRSPTPRCGRPAHDRTPRSAASERPTGTRNR